VKPHFAFNHKFLPKPLSRPIFWGAIAITLILSGGTLFYVTRFYQSAAQSDRPAVAAERTAISALGHIQPEGEVILLSAPTSANGLGSRVAQLHVQAGDWVDSGDLVATLDSAKSLQAAVQRAKVNVEMARARLAQVKAGAQVGELEAQQAEIARLQADLDGQLIAQEQTIGRLTAEKENAQTEYTRYQTLFDEGAITASQLENQHLLLVNAQEQWSTAKVQLNRTKTTFQEQINAAQATLKQMAEVRPTDIQAAEAEVQSAIATVTQAQAELELASVRAPIAGEVLEVYARPGEVIDHGGIVALGQTQQMTVIAEVYELDVGQVRVGQPTTITSDAFVGSLRGEVVQIGSQINPQKVLSTDPAADVDKRVVEVTIHLEPAASQRVASLTNMQVSVLIDLKADSSE